MLWREPGRARPASICGLRRRLVRWIGCGTDWPAEAEPQQAWALLLQGGSAQPLAHGERAKRTCFPAQGHEAPLTRTGQDLSGRRRPDGMRPATAHQGPASSRWRRKTGAPEARCGEVPRARRRVVRGPPGWRYRPHPRVRGPQRNRMTKAEPLTSRALICAGVGAPTAYGRNSPRGNLARRQETSFPPDRGPAEKPLPHHHRPIMVNTSPPAQAAPSCRNQFPAAPPLYSAARLRMAFGAA